jgi:endonuclease YncB( thermonuclease family)
MSLHNFPKAAALAGLIPLLFGCEPPPTTTVIGPVRHIVDGDTFFIGRTRIRLCGIDAPEQGKPGYRQSAKFLQRMIEGKEVRCVPIGTGAPCNKRNMPQSSSRTIAQCYYFEDNIADLIVEAGHAKDWR